jgi:hypothetical protein
MRLVESSGRQGSAPGREPVSEIRETVCAIPLCSGGSIEIDRVNERLNLRSSDGQLVLRIRMTSEGVVLTVAACRLEIEETKTLHIAVDKLEIEARQGIELHTPGSIEQRIGGDIVTHCEGKLQLECGSVAAVAHSGDLVLDSTHDVALQGERVRLNC